MADLTGINAAKDVQIATLKNSLNLSQDMNAAAAKELRRNKGKATRKTIACIIGALASGYILHDALR